MVYGTFAAYHLPAASTSAASTPSSQLTPFPTYSPMASSLMPVAMFSNGLAGANGECAAERGRTHR